MAKLFMLSCMRRFKGKFVFCSLNFYLILKCKEIIYTYRFIAVTLVILVCSAAHHSMAIQTKGNIKQDIQIQQKYLFYFHGKIIEDQGLVAKSSVYGQYQYQDILDRLAGFGFNVMSEVRPKNADAQIYAKKAVQQINTLLKSGVPPKNITIVGASKGAYIAALISYKAQNPNLKFVFLAGCHAGTVRQILHQGIRLYGHVLALRDVADTRLAGSCARVFAASPSIGQHQEQVLHLVSGHGIIFRPLDEWVFPTIKWANEAGKVK